MSAWRSYRYYILLIGRYIVGVLMKKLTPKQAAAVLDFSVHTLKRWRKGNKYWRPGLGPRFFSIHGRIYYSAEALSDWLALSAPRERQRE